MEYPDRITAAIDYTNAGILVHPLSPPNDAKQSPGKRPILKGWQKLTIPADGMKLEHWFKLGDYNIGAVCGKASDLTVIDVDWYIKGLWADILKDVDTSSWIVQQRTPDRWHWLFRFNPKFQLQHCKPLGIDMLGEAGNVVMAPSVHHTGDVYQISGDIAERPELPEIVIKRLDATIRLFNELVSIINKCRPTFKKFLDAVFADDKSDIYHDLSLFRSASGRQRTLHIFAELMVNGATERHMLLLSMMMFGDSFDLDKTVYEISQIKPTPATSESIKLDVVLSKYYQEPKKSYNAYAEKKYYTVKVKPDGEAVISLNLSAIADGIREKYHIISYNEEIFVYSDGYYKRSTVEVKSEIQAIAKSVGYIGPLKKATDEIMHYIKYADPSMDYPFNGNGMIPVANGVIAIDVESETITLLPHSHEYRFNYILPVVYNPDAPDTIHDEMICRYVEERYRDILYQIPAQAIIQIESDPFKKAYLIQGDPHAGKSTYLALNEMVFGIDNISGESLHSIADNRFAKASLEGKMFNVYDDLSDIPMKDTGEFKTLTGKRMHSVERKGKEAYMAPITAVHIYTCNAPPSFDTKVKQDTAFWERWEYVVFPYWFKKDAGFTKRMFTEENISGYFNRILRAIIDIKRDGLKISSTASEVREMWSYDSDPLYQYMKENLEFGDIHTCVDKDSLLQTIQRWAIANEIDMAKIPGTTTGLTQSLDKYDVVAKRVTNNSGVQVYVYEMPGKWKPYSKFIANRVALKTEQGHLP